MRVSARVRVRARVRGRVRVRVRVRDRVRLGDAVAASIPNLFRYAAISVRPGNSSSSSASRHGAYTDMFGASTFVYRSKRIWSFPRPVAPWESTATSFSFMAFTSPAHVTKRPMPVVFQSAEMTRTTLTMGRGSATEPSASVRIAGTHSRRRTWPAPGRHQSSPQPSPLSGRR